MEPSNTPIPEPMQGDIAAPSPAPTPVQPVTQIPAPAPEVPVQEMPVQPVTQVPAPGSIPAPDTHDESTEPLQPADPVPGSIGSAISVPASDGTSVGTSNQTPSVAFNDPAMQQNPMAATAPVGAKKKMSNTTIILLTVLGVVVIAILVMVLIKMLNPELALGE